MSQLDYERAGRFIYGAYRFGADKTDIANWMTDDLSIACSGDDGDLAAGKLYTAIAAK